MDENLKFYLGRKCIGFLMVFFLFSGPAGGKEISSKKTITLMDLLRPVLKTVMIAEEVEPADVGTTAPENRNKHAQSTGNANKEKEQDRYRICWGDTCWSIARRYGMSIKELAALNPGLNPERIKSGDYLQVRRTAATSRGRSGPRSIPTTARRELALFHPLKGGRLTSRYGMRWGRMHRGIDLAAPAGTSIYASAPGTVTFAGWQGGYGLIVIIDHGNYQTKYAHNRENLVRVGDKVLRGQPVAKVGRTGNATGNHLHFELVLEGEPVDPLPYL